MKFIKKFLKYIVGIVGFFIGLVWIMNKNTSRKVKKIKKNIKSNEKKDLETWIQNNAEILRQAEKHKLDFGYPNYLGLGGKVFHSGDSLMYYSYLIKI